MRSLIVNNGDPGPGFGAGLEVLIDNTSNGRSGLEASTNGSGQGVLANATSGAVVEGISTRGPGLWGVAGGASATALKATGKTTLSGPSTLAGQSTFTGATSFARSGKLSIAAHGSQGTRTHIALSASSIVLATIQGNVAGVYVQGVTTVTGTSGSFTIHLNKATPAALSIGWFVAN